MSVERNEGKRTLGKPKRRLEDNTKIYVSSRSGMGVVDWIVLAQVMDK